MKPRVAFIIDDIVKIPARNGVTNRFLSVAKELKKQPGIFIYIADRGASDFSKFSQLGFPVTVFPSLWLYDENYSKILNHLSERAVNIVHVCNAHTMVPLYGAKLAESLDAALVCDMHDINSEILRGLDCPQEQIKASDILQSRVASACERVMIMSAKDLNWFMQDDTVQNRLVLAPNGIEPYRETDLTIANGKDVVFVGNLHYPPNLLAADLIDKEIAPAVIRTHPEATFTIIGETPLGYTPANSDHVKSTGSVEDLSPYMKKAILGLAPLTVGSGMKVKVLTYGKYGLPVVGTPLANDGLPKLPGLIIGSTIPELAREISTLLSNRRMAENLGSDLRQRLEDDFSWSKICSKIFETYREITEGKKHRSAISSDECRAARQELLKMKHAVPMHLEEPRYKEAAKYMIPTLREFGEGLKPVQTN